MTAQEIIRYIASADKKTPVRLYVKENAPIDYGSAHVFGAGDKIVFGDWGELAPILEDDVLVGANAVIIEGVHVGRGAVVAAGAVVVRDVPENAVVAGCPARVIKMKDEGTTQKTALEAALRAL